jgi:hypothetical protein
MCPIKHGFRYVDVLLGGSSICSSGFWIQIYMSYQSHWMCQNEKKTVSLQEKTQGIFLYIHEYELLSPSSQIERYRVIYLSWFCFTSTSSTCSYITTLCVCFTYTIIITFCSLFPCNNKTYRQDRGLSQDRERARRNLPKFSLFLATVVVCVDTSHITLKSRLCVTHNPRTP